MEGLGIIVYQGDLFDPLPVQLRGRLDVIVANAPYVPTGAIGLMPPEARLHEPFVALDGGADGLELHRRIAVGGTSWLRPGGLLIVEVSEQQAPVLAAHYAAVGLSAEISSSEEWDATAVIGRSVHV